MKKNGTKTFRTSLVKSHTTLIIPCMPKIFEQPKPNQATWLGPPGVAISSMPKERVSYDGMKNLKLQNVTTSITGVYSCEATVSNGTYINYVFVIIYKMPHVGLRIPLVFRVNEKDCEYAIHHLDDMITAITGQLCKDISKRDPEFNKKCRFQMEPMCMAIDNVDLVDCPFLNNYQCYGLHDVKTTVDLACAKPPYDALCKLIRNTVEPLKHVAKLFCSDKDGSVSCWHDGEDQDSRILAKICFIRPLLSSCKKFKRLHNHLNLEKTAETSAVVKKKRPLSRGLEKAYKKLFDPSTSDANGDDDRVKTDDQRSGSEGGAGRKVLDTLSAKVRKKKVLKNKLRRLHKRSLLFVNEDIELYQLNHLYGNILIDAFVDGVKQNKTKNFYNFSTEAKEFRLANAVHKNNMNKMMRYKRHTENKYLIIMVNYIPIFQQAMDTSCIDECVYLKNLNRAHNETEALRKMWDGIDSLPEKPKFLHFLKGSVRKYSYKYVHYCSPGYFFPNQHSHTCLPCAPGTYSHGGAYDYCERCPVDTYQTEWGTTECIKCPDNGGTGVEDGLSTDLSCYNPGKLWTVMVFRVYSYIGFCAAFSTMLIATVFILIHCGSPQPKLKAKKGDLREANKSQKKAEQNYQNEKIKEDIKEKEKMELYNKREVNDPIPKPKTEPIPSSATVSSVSTAASSKKSFGSRRKTGRR